MLLLLAFTPLAFGTVEPWSLSIMELISFIMLAGVMLDLSSKKASPFRVPGLLPLSLFIGYIILQLIPLPAIILKVISPVTHDLYFNTVWSGESMQWGTISLNKKATINELLRWASYASFYIVIVQLVDSRERFKRLINLSVIFMAIVSLFSIVQAVSSNGKIYWMRDLTQGGEMFGPYVNRNHYAGLVASILPVALALFIYYKPSQSSGSYRERLLKMLGGRRYNISVMLLVSVIVLSMSVFMSLSRGGIISLIISVIFMGLMILTITKETKKGGTVFIILLMIILFAAWFAWGPVTERFGLMTDKEGSITDVRKDLWSDTLQIIKDFPLFGTGMGTFSDIYNKYRTIPHGKIVGHAHNFYLELFAEGGIIAGTIMVSFLISVILRSVRTLRKRHDRYAIFISLGIMAGLISILMHSTVDFSVHIGANGLYLFFLLGMLVTCSSLRFENVIGSHYLERSGGAPFKAIGVMVIVILIFCAQYQGRVIAGSRYYSRVDKSSIDSMMTEEEMDRSTDDLAMASRLDRLEARYSIYLADLQWVRGDRDLALSNYKRGVGNGPTKAEYVQKLGIALGSAGDVRTAEGLLRWGVMLDRKNPFRYQVLGSWLINRQKADEGLDMITTAISLEPDRTGEYIALLAMSDISDADIKRTLPDNFMPHYIFAEYMVMTGNHKDAVSSYISAFEKVKDPAKAGIMRFIKAHRYFIEIEAYDESVNIMEKAIDIFPGDIDAMLALAISYEKNGQLARAGNMYEEILRSHPGDERAIRSLGRIYGQ
ncbi:MAG: O-antigen ligase family protein [Nitrospirota bacterium]|nr:MAG: O-antigen ligase family protein [Nitrospirota bacterium]